MPTAKKKPAKKKAAPRLEGVLTTRVRKTKPVRRRRALTTRPLNDEAREIRMAEFIATLREWGNVRMACEKVGITRHQASSWRRQYEEFRRLWEEAMEDAADLLELEAVRRGRDGIDTPITYKGRITGHFKTYSDKLLETSLRAARPEKYARRHEVTGSGGGPVQIERIERVIVDAPIAVAADAAPGTKN